VPAEISRAVGVHCPGIYTFAYRDIRRLADLGDPRITSAFAPHISDAEREAINAADPTVQRVVALAEAMERGERVVVSWAYGRAFQEVTKMPWAPSDDGIEISTDDMVRPVERRPQRRCLY
jgi:hypothetical protein